MTSRQIKVLQVTPAVTNERDEIIGGGEFYPVCLAEALAARVDEFDVRVVAYNDPDPSLRYGSFHRGTKLSLPRRHSGANTYDPIGLPPLRDLIWADVVHIHQATRATRWIYDSLLALRHCGLFPGSIFFTWHGAQGRGWAAGRYEGFDQHLAVSNYAANVCPFKMTTVVIYGGARFSRVEAQPAVAKRISVIGRVLPHKKIETLIEALPEGLGLDVIGPLFDSGYARFLNEFARTRGSDVTFHGTLPPDAIQRLLQRSCCLGSVSESGGELLGLVCLDALACACPVVGWDQPPLNEFIRHGVNGYLVPPGDVVTLRSALRALMNDAPFSLQLRRGAAKSSAVFSWDAVSDAVAAQYKSKG